MNGPQLADTCYCDSILSKYPNERVIKYAILKYKAINKDIY